MHYIYNYPSENYVNHIQNLDGSLHLITRVNTTYKYRILSASTQTLNTNIFQNRNYSIVKFLEQYPSEIAIVGTDSDTLYIDYITSNKKYTIDIGNSITISDFLGYIQYKDEHYFFTLNNNQYFEILKFQGITLVKDFPAGNGNFTLTKFFQDKNHHYVFLKINAKDYIYVFIKGQLLFSVLNPTNESTDLEDIPDVMYYHKDSGDGGAGTHF